MRLAAVSLSYCSCLRLVAGLLGSDYFDTSPDIQHKFKTTELSQEFTRSEPAAAGIHIPEDFAFAEALSGARGSVSLAEALEVSRDAAPRRGARASTNLGAATLDAEHEARLLRQRGARAGRTPRGSTPGRRAHFSRRRRYTLRDAAERLNPSALRSHIGSFPDYAINRKTPTTKSPKKQIDISAMLEATRARRYPNPLMRGSCDAKTGICHYPANVTTWRSPNGATHKRTTFNMNNQPQWSECDYPGNVVLWYRVPINGYANKEDVSDSCDVPCIAPASSERCAEKANGILYALPHHYGKPPVDKNTSSRFNIGVSMEPTAIFQQQSRENVLRNLSFDILSTSDRSTDVPIHYFSFYDWQHLLDVGFSKLSGWRQRKGDAVAFVAANCPYPRSLLVSRLATALSTYGIEVHSLSLCVPDGTVKIPRDLSKTKSELLAPYRVYLAFENSVSPGYVTEKIFSGYVAGSVNLYHGAADIARFVPPDSFINVQGEVPTDEALHEAVRQVVDVLQNENAWSRFMAWRQQDILSWHGGHFFNQPGGPWSEGFMCRMCRLVCVRARMPYCEGKVFDSNTQRLVSHKL